MSLDTDYTWFNRLVVAALLGGFVFGIIAIANRYLDQRPFRTLFGHSNQPVWVAMLTGAGLWFVPVGITMVGLASFGWMDFIVHGSIGEVGSAALQTLVFVFLLEALPEELVFRGYVFLTLSRRYPYWVVNVVQSLLFVIFAILIGAATSFDRVVIFFCFGLVLGLLRASSGTVWAPIGFHLAFQTVVQLVGPAHPEIEVVPLQLFLAMAFWVPFALVWWTVEYVYRSTASSSERA